MHAGGTKTALYSHTMTLATTFVQAGVDQHWQILVGRRKRRANASDDPGLVGGFVKKNETEEGGRLAEPSPQAEATGGSRTVLAVPTSQITGAMAASSTAPPRRRLLCCSSAPFRSRQSVAVPQVPLPVKQAPAPAHRNPFPSFVRASLKVSHSVGTAHGAKCRSSRPPQPCTAH